MTPQEIEAVTELIKQEVATQVDPKYLSWVEITETEYQAAAIKILRRIDEMRKPVTVAAPAPRAIKPRK